ncbi:DUF885 family protein [Novosphingobium sp. TH158]|uniref:DUF885 domain-containing protein n=1 Tax=Novosphingobium sp. TH158 TaxID=2067455 RepID=UPI000C7ADE33|nr:DUF885 domain-containing protein [Novosphingobium sp. TH158]PLK25626.1 DUF885 domain-containing protein [Novosphingobium sp. TH158]
MGLNRAQIAPLIALLASSAIAPSALAQEAPRLATAPMATASVTARSEDQKLMLLFAHDAKRDRQLNPLQAIYRGEAADPALVAQTFTDALDRRELAAVRLSLSALSRIDRRRLSPERQISFDVFQGDKRTELEMLQPDVLALTSVRPLTHFGGLHVEFPSLVAGALPFRNEADYRAALALEKVMPKVLDQAVTKFREGLSSGVVDSRLTTSNMIAQIDALLAQKLEDSPFYAPILEFPKAVPESARPQLARAYADTILNEVYPAYRRLRNFLANEYLPAARTQPGISAMKGGAGLYRKLIKVHTSLSLDPEEVHRLGLGEVARIQREMEDVKVRLGNSGSLRQFFDVLRTDPRYHPKSREELAKGFALIARTVDAQIPHYFYKVPRTRLEIQPYPAYREKYEAGGSYNQGSADGSRPGVFFYNAYDLPSRFLTGMATLYLHEGAPGHHFQISLAQENTSLPDFQRFGGNTAFVEGWALYAETLGYSMGLYKDPMQHWGTLDDEMLRAMRLVVDTGIHAKGWSREQAIEYMLANSGMGRTDATAEVERYIAWPGQALAYKVGALTIQRLRRKAEADLGPKFDLRAFHEQVLGSGALPLPVLEAKIDRWIATSR